MEKLKVIIATESYVTNQGFHLIFNKLRHSHIVGKVCSMSELINLLDREAADIILISTELLDDLAINSLLKKLEKNRSELVAYFTTKSGKLDYQNQFAEKINFHDSKDEVLNKISGLMDRMIGEKDEIGNSELSEREKDILSQVALGLTNNEIADKLFISAHTVITHRKKITKKLGIKSVSALTVYAIINGLIEMEDV